MQVILLVCALLQHHNALSRSVSVVQVWDAGRARHSAVGVCQSTAAAGDGLWAVRKARGSHGVRQPVRHLPGQQPPQQVDSLIVDLLFPG